MGCCRQCASGIVVVGEGCFRQFEGILGTVGIVLVVNKLKLLMLRVFGFFFFYNCFCFVIFTY